MSKQTGQPNLNLWSAIIGVLGVVVGAALGYFGTRASADAQIRIAQENANVQLTNVWVQVYGPINAAQTVEARSTEKALLTTSTPTEAIEITPTESLSKAIITMNNFYNWINTAGNKSDLFKSWNLETGGINGFQCREASGCDFSKFQEKWWASKVQYKLYDCGSNLVDTELRYYARDPLVATTPTTPLFIRYQLVDDKGELKINMGFNIEGPGADCKLAISVP